MKLGRWSTTAGSNNTSPPDGWPEGQAPSTVNDCARELMASVRTAFTDLQFFDQDITPTFVNATTFTVPGTQTSALHTGRRLKLFDAATQYATILSSTATANTQVVISGTAITAALSSMGIGIVAADANTGLPKKFGRISASAIEVPGAISVSAIVAGTSRVLTTLSVDGTVVAQNITKAWVNVGVTVGGVNVISSFNISSVSRSATGVARINFTTAFVDTLYFSSLAPIGFGVAVVATDVSKTASSCKFTLRRGDTSSAVDGVEVNGSFLR